MELLILTCSVDNNPEPWLKEGGEGKGAGNCGNLEEDRGIAYTT